MEQQQTLPQGMRHSITIFCLYCLVVERATFFTGIDDPPITPEQAFAWALEAGWSSREEEGFRCPYCTTRKKMEDHLATLSDEERALLLTPVLLPPPQDEMRSTTPGTKQKRRRRYA